MSALLRRNPDLQGDMAILIRENDEIRSKTGISVLGKGCDQLQAEESIETLAATIPAVERDVASGRATDQASVAHSLNLNLSETLGTDESETKDRICVLSRDSACQVFDPSMCQ